MWYNISRGHRGGTGYLVIEVKFGGANGKIGIRNMRYVLFKHFITNRTHKRNNISQFSLMKYEKKKKVRLIPFRPVYGAEWDALNSPLIYTLHVSQIRTKSSSSLSVPAHEL